MFASDIIQQIIKLSTIAGAKIINYYQKNIDYQTKDDGTYITKADTSSHNIIVTGLAEIMPSIPILSEESKNTPYSIRKKWNEYWLIDPLDGTKDFINGTDEFCINISYIKDNRPIFGLIYAPVTKTHFYGIKNKGAFLYKNQTTTKITASKKHSPLRIVIGNYSYNNKYLQQHLKKLGKYNIQTVGSALKFVYIANGKYDYYPKFSPCSEWDTAAGVCILEEAGGKVVDINGKILYYNKSDNLLSTNFISSGR